MSNTPMKPSEVLSKAADLIEPEGAWGQGGRNPRVPGDNCSHCAMTAIWNFAEDKEAAVSIFLRRTLAASSEIAVFRWNDAIKRTQSEVVKALRDAADLARSEGQ